MNLKRIFFVVIISIGFAMSANAGNIADTDGDTIPDVFDNCPIPQDFPVNLLPFLNGPNEAPNNQIDSDNDGFGNRCDADFNNVGATVDLADFNLFLAAFAFPGNNQFDLNYDGLVIGLLDFNIYLALHAFPPGGI
jgi:hypothetical protein